MTGKHTLSRKAGRRASAVITSVLLLLTMAAALTACEDGGGGAGPSPTPANNTPPATTPKPGDDVHPLVGTWEFRVYFYDADYWDGDMTRIFEYRADGTGHVVTREFSDGILAHEEMREFEWNTSGDTLYLSREYDGIENVVEYRWQITDRGQLIMLDDDDNEATLDRIS